MQAVRQLEGRIGAVSAASYVELGRCASRHTHRVELHSWPASSFQSTGRCATTTIGRASHSLQTRPCRLTNSPQLLSPLCLHVVCRIHAYMHAHPQQGRQAASCMA